jgi:tetratricopeptide (TPR) repeat protein
MQNKGEEASEGSENCGSSLTVAGQNADTRGLLAAVGERLKLLLPVLLPSLFTFLIYLPVVRYALVWDDGIFLRDLPAYRLRGMGFESLTQPFALSPNYFRPLTILTFMGELRLAGQAAWIFHLTNLSLHALNTGLVAILAYRLGGTKRPVLIPLVAGLLYGLHPALIEGVAFISSRFDLLMTTFLLSALLGDHTLRGCSARLRRPLVVGLAFLLAALSKEMALAFALALPFWHLASNTEEQSPNTKASLQRIFKQNIPVYAAVVIAGLIYLGIRYASLGYLLVSLESSHIARGAAWQHLLLVARSLAGYIGLVVWPFTSLTPIHYSQLPIPANDIVAWLSLGLLGLLSAGLIWLLRRYPQPAWLLLGGVVALFPVANLLPLELGGGAFIAERFLLFPLVLFILAGVSLFRELEQAGHPIAHPLTTAALTVWLILSLAVVQLNLPNWQDDLSLWTWAARRAPHSSMPPTNLSLEYIHRGNYQRSLQLAEAAINLDPGNANAWNNAGLALFFLQDYPQAQQAFALALELAPDSALFWNNLAGALREQGELRQAEEILLDQALPLDPNLPVIHQNLGIVYLKASRPDLAAIHLQEALRLLPENQLQETQALLAETQRPELWFDLGLFLLETGEYQAAAQAFDQAGVLGAPLEDAITGISLALIEMGAWRDAEQVLFFGLDSAPNDARLVYNLGRVAEGLGDFERAKELYERAAYLAPEWDLPILSLEALSGE